MTTAEQLRAMQFPLKDCYRQDPQAALVTCHAQAQLDSPGIACRIRTPHTMIQAGLHPATGGDGSAACSGDMLLEALVGCAGVTLRAVATALEIPLRGGTITAQGQWDARGTLGVSKEVPVGMTGICLHFDLECDAGADQIEKLLKLTERYCVVYQTLLQPPRVTVTH